MKCFTWRIWNNFYACYLSEALSNCWPIRIIVLQSGVEVKLINCVARALVHRASSTGNVHWQYKHLQSMTPNTIWQAKLYDSKLCVILRILFTKILSTNLWCELFCQKLSLVIYALLNSSCTFHARLWLFCSTTPASWLAFKKPVPLLVDFNAASFNKIFPKKKWLCLAEIFVIY